MNSATRKPYSFWRTFALALAIVIPIDVIRHLIGREPLFDVPLVWWQPIIYVVVRGIEVRISVLIYHYLFRLLISPEKDSNSR